MVKGANRCHQEESRVTFIFDIGTLLKNKLDFAEHQLFSIFCGNKSW